MMPLLDVSVAEGLVAQSASILTLDNFWLSALLKILLCTVMLMVVSLVGGYLEHKAMGHLQNRTGPMEAGPHGSLQLVADGIKFVQKEDIVPRAADKLVFAVAPGVALVPALLGFLVIPIGPGVWAEDLEIGLFYALAIGSIGVLGILMGGWASANKFSLIGGIRAAAQLIAYELPLILAAAAVAVQAGSLSLVDIVESQATMSIFGTPVSMWFVFPQLLGFGIFVMAALAELSRPPFDMPIADSELVFGYMTEYTGIKFAMFLLTEYGGMIFMSGLITVLYLGGWQALPGVPLPGCEAAAGISDCGVWGTLLGVGITLGKIMALVFFMVWLRVAYPRLREDQLQKISWLVLIPLSLVNIAIVAIGKVAL
ncbi:NADH-quinone oxidoreductase subunit NuoH [Salsipaludibacter albus]|jgi:NADH-quinone oxidoreductase subunit H|uniref:NADH-quinone oxidoreductase subunit NuoH n=1 Tax=Salsipaludibacter albus TaxID=2849650 RepID=UPI0023685DDD|nr:NADH-quinone oxidoreductase subunit NuoH [Salsipaludibacter albus]